MAFTFEKASCVVVGSFNTYILHPQWLAKRNIIEQGVVPLQVNLSQPGFRFNLASQGTTWVVSPERVSVESADSATNCGEIVSRVLRALPETPLIAIGNNVHFVATLDERERLRNEYRSFPPGACGTEDGEVVQQSFEIAIKRSEAKTVRLTLSIRLDKIELTCNSNTRLSNSDNANWLAIEATEEFYLDREYCERLSAQVYGAKASYDPVDNPA